MIYFDYNATTPLDPEVLETMMPYLKGFRGNPSSVHQLGRLARHAVDKARQQIKDLIHAPQAQVIFTGSATEANNLAIKGFALQYPSAGTFAVTTTEHESVLQNIPSLQKMGWNIHWIPVNIQGEALVSSLENINLCSIGLANNETGVIQDIQALQTLDKDQNIIIHTDAVQAAGKMPINFEELKVHMMSLSSHKLYGPAGIGALIIDSNVCLHPLIEGGGQEYNLRSGTENIAGIVGFGAAAEKAQNALEKRQAHMLKLREAFEQGLKQISGSYIVAEKAKQRLANTTSFALPGIQGETLLMLLDQAGFAVSAGSACSSSRIESSHVLQAMQLPNWIAENAIRISFGIHNSLDEVEKLLTFLNTTIIPFREHYDLFQSL